MFLTKRIGNETYSIIDHFLLQWKEDRLRKSLLLRGARQVG